MLDLFFDPEDKGKHVSLKRRLTLSELHEVVCQKLALFVMTTVRTSNPTMYWDINYGVAYVILDV
jgi:hypothetical protein